MALSFALHRSFRVLALTCLSLAAACVSSVARSDEQEILRAERVLTTAWIKHDIAAAGKVVADDYQYWSFAGVRQSKADLMRMIEKSNEGEMRIEDAVVRIYGNSAI